MIIAHVAVAGAEDSLVRSAPHEGAHLARAAELRARGFLVGAGRAPDGRSADLFVRAPDAGAIRRLVEEDPYFARGVWTGYAVASFSQFLEPWRVPPLGAGDPRRVTVVEGPTLDADMATLALVEARGRGRLIFGGLFPDGGTLAVMNAPEPDAPREWLAETGFWDAASLRARPLLYVL